YEELTGVLRPLDADGVAVQRMAPAGVVVEITSAEDPLFGPVVGFGVAGVPSDLLGDRTHRFPPLTDTDVADMVSGIRAAPLLAGYRGTTSVDQVALHDLLARVSVLADDLPEVQTLRLNPVVAHGGGIVVLGASATVARYTGRTDAGKRALTRGPGCSGKVQREVGRAVRSVAGAGRLGGSVVGRDEALPAARRDPRDRPGWLGVRLGQRPLRCRLVAADVDQLGVRVAILLGRDDARAGRRGGRRRSCGGWRLATGGKQLGDRRRRAPLEQVPLAHRVADRDGVEPPATDALADELRNARRLGVCGVGPVSLAEEHAHAPREAEDVLAHLVVRAPADSRSGRCSLRGGSDRRGRGGVGRAGLRRGLRVLTGGLGHRVRGRGDRVLSRRGRRVGRRGVVGVAATARYEQDAAGGGSQQATHGWTFR